MHNFPFAEARIRRERDRNPALAGFLSERNNAELTQRRDIVSDNGIHIENTDWLVCLPIEARHPLTPDVASARRYNEGYTGGSPRQGGHTHRDGHSHQVTSR